MQCRIGLGSLSYIVPILRLKTRTAAGYYRLPLLYNTIQYNTIICNAHKVEYRTSNLRRGQSLGGPICVASMRQEEENCLLLLQLRPCFFRQIQFKYSTSLRSNNKKFWGGDTPPRGHPLTALQPSRRLGRALGASSALDLSTLSPLKLKSGYALAVENSRASRASERTRKILIGT